MLTHFCGIFLFSHCLRNDAADRPRGLDLCRSRCVGVRSEREARVVMPQHSGYRLDVHAVLQRQCRERMPLRYNYDKPEKPRISRVLRFGA